MSGLLRLRIGSAETFAPVRNRSALRYLERSLGLALEDRLRRVQRAANSSMMRSGVGIQLAIQQVTGNQHDSGIIALTALGLRFPQLPVMDPAKPARKAPVARTTEPRPGVGDANSSYALLTRAR